jgi:hypothetical protein
MCVPAQAASQPLLGEAEFRELHLMRDFAHYISDILALFADAYSGVRKVVLAFSPV